MNILKVEGLTKRFGGITAVSDCSFNVEENSIKGLIGPNGSGKTTTFNLILNLLKPDSGNIFFKEKKINNMKIHKIVRLGIGRTFQIVRLWKKLTVRENLRIAGAYGIRNWQEKASELLEYVGLTKLQNEVAENLSFGQQKLLELGLALMPEPEFIMLDEPVAGVHPVLVNKLKNMIRDLRDSGKTFLIIEHNVPFVFDICDTIIVLDHGEVIAEGVPDEIKKDEDVLNAYLGGI